MREQAVGNSKPRTSGRTDERTLDQRPACGGQKPEQLTDTGGAVELNRKMVDALIETVRVFDGGRVEVKWKSQNRSDAVSAAFTEGVPRLM